MILRFREFINEKFKWEETPNRSAFRFKDKERYYLFSSDNWDYRISVSPNGSGYPWFGFRARKSDEEFGWYDVDIITNDNIWEVIETVGDILENDRIKYKVKGYTFSNKQNKKGRQRAEFYKRFLSRNGWKFESPSGDPFGSADQYIITKVNENQEVLSDTRWNDIATQEIQDDDNLREYCPCEKENSCNCEGKCDCKFCKNYNIEDEETHIIYEPGNSTFYNTLSGKTLYK
ncbi:MAG: hypothetical protein SLAVMIC_00400 [uncultured marine phage]|uniref:Uncharacterized protein n=1 Tax=uncultured marine phage TaxID=707152 RepID=A0A8D9CBH1_9VIRU|nr:MAG: hypothetical protein SLAVMIC_00400 [uncultured marine phage]